MDKTTLGTPPPSPSSPDLADLLCIIHAANQPDTSSTAADSLVKFMKASKAKGSAGLSCEGTNAKLILLDWITESVKSEKRDTDVVTMILSDLSMVLQQLSICREDLERWIPILDSIYLLTKACLDHIRELPQEDRIKLVQGPALTSLATIAFDSTAFMPMDRQKTQQHKDWIMHILALNTSFLEYTLKQVDQLSQHGTMASDLAILVCNMLCNFVAVSKSDFRLLRNNLGFMVKLIPSCKNSKSLRLNTPAIICMLCREILDALAKLSEATALPKIITLESVNIPLALARFYVLRLPHVLKLVAHDMAKDDEEFADCMNLVKATLVSVRSRLLANGPLRKSFPEKYQDSTKPICNLEEQVVSALVGATDVTDDERHRILGRLVSASGRQINIRSQLTLLDNDWNLGRLYIILGILATFDELSPDLQLLLFPLQESTSEKSLFSMLLTYVRGLGVEAYVPVFESDPEFSDDVYLTVLSKLCLFAHLIQPKQFVRLQVNMTALVFDHSELEASLGRDWWNHIMQYVRSQLSKDSTTLLACFPFDCLLSQNLDDMITYCYEQWGSTCELMAENAIVIEAFYATYQYIACISAILSRDAPLSSAIEDLKPKMVNWSLTQIGGARQLAELVLHNKTDVNKVYFSVGHILKFVSVLQPLPITDVIQILDACVQLQEFQDTTPLSLHTILFLESCAVVVQKPVDEYREEFQHILDKLYSLLLASSQSSLIQERLAKVVWIGRFFPDIYSRHMPGALQRRQRLYQEVESGKKIADKGRGVVWQGVESRVQLARRYQEQHHCVTTLHELGQIDRNQASPDECLVAVMTAKRKLQSLYEGNLQESTISPAMKATVAAATLELQQLAQFGQTSASARAVG
ncbi:hypothetical protein BGZ94_003054 [Podila epigama]|nr:hypothetical protein BGZ94_003054 [Podila epigama]